MVGGLGRNLDRCGPAFPVLDKQQDSIKHIFCTSSQIHNTQYTMLYKNLIIVIWLKQYFSFIFMLMSLFSRTRREFRKKSQFTPEESDEGKIAQQHKKNQQTRLLTFRVRGHGRLPLYTTSCPARECHSTQAHHRETVPRQSSHPVYCPP